MKLTCNDLHFYVFSVSFSYVLCSFIVMLNSKTCCRVSFFINSGACPAQMLFCLSLVLNIYYVFMVSESSVIKLNYFNKYTPFCAVLICLVFVCLFF
ncbi:hypothetical protein GDO78_008473 [Eleutherodactylus coqui]|uniref:Uncharacterized protein n=1 Tax=Eleutherodactylus coqui TaxID=57060 RepID=A0A8J6FD52_ELECQ|nr:hypothetical protein GDO78_008473 [Eleutherodactylus coqui]